MGPFNAYARSRRSRRTDNACFVSFTKVGTHETLVVFDRPVGVGMLAPGLLRAFEDIAARAESTARAVSMSQVTPEQILVEWDDVNRFFEGVAAIGDDFSFNAVPTGYGVNVVIP